jgi:hypothetical protein
MMKLNDDYRRALHVGLALHAVVVLFSLLITSTNSELLLRSLFVSLIAWWSGFGLIVFRRPTTPTKLDLFLIRWSYPVLWIIANNIMYFVWKLRGFVF